MQIPEGHVIATRKIRIRPTANQKQQIDKMAGVIRATYNLSVARINEMRRKERKWPEGMLENYLRDSICTNIHNDIEKYTAVHGPEVRPEQVITTMKKKEISYRYKNPLFLKKPWLAECPKPYRGRATFKAADAYKSSLSLWRRGIVKSFEMKFATKRRELERGHCFGIEQNVCFEDEDTSKRSGSLTILGVDGNIRFFEKPPIDKTPVMACELSKDACGEYWLHVPIFRRKKEPRGEAFAAIDPGGVVPWAFYSSTGESGSLGVSMNRRLAEVSSKISAIDSELSRAKDVKKELLRRKLFRAKKRIRDHEHYRAINFFTDRYDGVLLPKLKTKNISRGLKSKATRTMFDISHYTFLRRLEERCVETNTVLETPAEHYTSKTCGRCAASNIPGRDRDGTYRPYRCMSCGLSAHRDVHAARNIFMKWYIEAAS